MNHELSVVPKFYSMNPKTEDILPDGSYLRDGMVVLIENPDCREDLDKNSLGSSEGWRMQRVLDTNRWAKISFVQHYEAFRSNAPADKMVSFIAEYEDGTKRKRQWGESHAWLVKKDSMPEGGKLLNDDQISNFVNEIGALLHDEIQGVGVRGTDQSFGSYLAMEVLRRLLTTGRPELAKIDKTMDERFNEVCAIVHEALREAAGYKLPLNPSKEEYPELDEIAEKTTGMILGTS